MNNAEEVRLLLRGIDKVGYNMKSKEDLQRLLVLNLCLYELLWRIYGERSKDV